MQFVVGHVTVAQFVRATVRGTRFISVDVRKHDLFEVYCTINRPKL